MRNFDAVYICVFTTKFSNLMCAVFKLSSQENAIFCGLTKGSHEDHYQHCIVMYTIHLFIRTQGAIYPDFSRNCMISWSADGAKIETIS